MGLIFPFLTYWLALTPRGRRRSGTEVGAEELVCRRQRSTCLGTRVVEAEGLVCRRPRSTCLGTREAEAEELVCHRQRSTCLGTREAGAEELVCHRQRSTCLGTRAAEEEGLVCHRPRAASAPDYPGVPDCVVRDSSKAETKQQLRLTNLESNGSLYKRSLWFLQR
jgi:hypothetical protein